mmetsp:Transcript_13448/g.43399  ORF Transcript_13448/g.43399 Transcript_13448/m.43399 type:complete len:153 (-) Transcript_13448:74-532(-)
MLRFLALATAAVAFAPSARTSPRAFRLAAAEAGAAPAAGIQFYEGMFEPDVPDVKITRSRDGDNGVATFDFQAPSFFNCESEADVPQGAITAMTMMDEEGELSTPNVNARFVDGDPVGLVVRYEMTTPAAFDRFIRFMGRYAEANGLNFNKA